ncbi:hypothetical protein BDF14DRAFT_1959449 [Spinellus fusiger]|nr:hypothetical protein BDF14DRAFT_1959449 [Spinellus fusiger]
MCVFSLSLSLFLSLSLSLSKLSIHLNTYLHPYLQRIYDNSKNFHLSSKTLLTHLNKERRTEQETPKSYELLDLLDLISSRTLASKELIRVIAHFYRENCTTEKRQHIFLQILDRNLRMGVASKSVSRLLTLANDESDVGHQQLLKDPIMNVALAYSSPAEKEAELWNAVSSNKDAEWSISRKYDGVRCIAVVINTGHGHRLKFYSRTGKVFTSLEKLEASIRNRLSPEDSSFVLDGEVCVYDEGSDKENFLKSLSEIRKQNTPMPDPVYEVFDRIEVNDFIRGVGEEIHSVRQKRLAKFLGSPQKNIRQVEQTKLDSIKVLSDWKQLAVARGWEGLILRKNITYEGKRSRNMLKIKEWEDAEYTVVDVHKGIMRLSTTREEALVMTNITISHKNNIVSVGSGFSVQQRIEYGDDPSKLIGRKVTVRYFQESGEGGSKSLRFPSIKAIHQEERDT